MIACHISSYKKTLDQLEIVCIIMGLSAEVKPLQRTLVTNGVTGSGVSTRVQIRDTFFGKVFG